MREMSNLELAAWLAAFIDGEGCVYFRKSFYRGKHHQARVITVSSTTEELIIFAAKCCDALGIEYAKYGRNGATENRKFVYVLDIRKASSMAIFEDKVPLQHIEKKRKLSEALQNYRGVKCKGCGCFHDQETLGCKNCWSRHYFRKASQKNRDKKAAQLINDDAESGVLRS